MKSQSKKVLALVLMTVAIVQAYFILFNIEILSAGFISTLISISGAEIFFGCILYIDSDINRR